MSAIHFSQPKLPQQITKFSLKLPKSVSPTLSLTLPLCPQGPRTTLFPGCCYGTTTATLKPPRIRLRPTRTILRTRPPSKPDPAYSNHRSNPAIPDSTLLPNRARALAPSFRLLGSPEPNLYTYADQPPRSSVNIDSWRTCPCNKLLRDSLRRLLLLRRLSRKVIPLNSTSRPTPTPTSTSTSFANTPPPPPPIRSSPPNFGVFRGYPPLGS